MRRGVTRLCLEGRAVMRAAAFWLRETAPASCMTNSSAKMIFVSYRYSKNSFRHHESGFLSRSIKHRHRLGNTMAKKACAHPRIICCKQMVVISSITHK